MSPRAVLAATLLAAPLALPPLSVAQAQGQSQTQTQPQTSPETRIAQSTAAQGAARQAPRGADQPIPAAVNTPLSSIDWLSDSLDDVPPPRAARRPLPDTPGGAGLSEITVTPLAAPAPDGVGLTDPRLAGLPPTLWGASTTDDIARRIAALPDQPLPAARDALKDLMLARLDPPRGGGTPGALFTARVDALLRMGALDEAQALLDQADPSRPALFRRAFDVALLTGTEDQGCDVMRGAPGIAPSLPVRIFCLARRGDWPAAALTLETATALGQLSPSEDLLLARFLDPELADGAVPLPRYPAPTPLQWRMLEAIGERQPTAPLPLAFAHAELRPTSGWRARIEATERLVRAGALPRERLAAVYAERTPSASGGVWERVAAWQALDAALNEGQGRRATSRSLQRAWAEMSAAGLAQPFACLIAPELAGADLTRAGADLALRIRLLSTGYETAALDAPDSLDPVARALALGLPLAGPPPEAPLAAALAAAFADPPPALPRDLAAMRDEDRLGEALVTALSTVAQGTQADPNDLTAALTFLRMAGLEETARRSALSLLLLGQGT